jgi:uncharacterized protein involved in exopolysaccharide biosynthesis
MNDKPSFTGDDTEDPAESKPYSNANFLDYLIAFARYKKLMIGLPVAGAILVAAVSFCMPNVYKGTTKILPPQQTQSGAAALLAQLGGVASAAAGAAGIKNPNDLYIGMLKSRTVADLLIERFDLKKVYDRELMEKTRRKLAANTVISTGKDGLITIDVEDEDPKRAADIANAYADELLKLTKTLAVTEAAQRRLFFERQLTMSKDNLAKAEIALKDGLANRGVISVDSESRALVETVARLRAQISAKEIQFGAIQAFMTPNNQEYKRIQQELSSARNELSKLENGGAQSAQAGEVKGGLENIKLLRDVKYHQMLYELLSKQYEVARLDESKDASIIQVLDKALVPEMKVRPLRFFMTLGGGVAGLLVAIIIAISSMSNQSESQRRNEQIGELKRLLKYN